MLMEKISSEICVRDVFWNLEQYESTYFIYLVRFAC